MLKPTRAKRLSDFVPEAIGPAAARQGFANGEIVSRWTAIVGPEIAAVAAPQRLSAPPRGSAPDAPPERATLTLRVEGAFALEIQHRSAEIVERVNAHLGWPCVGQIKIRQGAIAPAGRGRSGRPELREPSDEQKAAVASAAGGIDDEGLAEAIDRLGRAALGKARRPPHA